MKSIVRVITHRISWVSIVRMAATKLSVVAAGFIVMLPAVFAFIFDSPGTSVDSNAVFKKNECFKSSSDLTNWLVKTTSGSSYKRFLRPGINESLDNNPPLRVNVSIDMNSMASVDEINSEYKIILKMDLEWVDDRLINNCSKTPLTMPLDAYHLDRIWSPKMGVPNIKDPDTSIIQGEATLILGQLRTDGYLHIRLNLLLNLFCYLDFALFPFDKQECFIKLESRSYARSDLMLVWRKDHPFRNLESFLMTGFKLVGYQLFNDSGIAKSNLFEDVYGMDMMSQVMVKLVIEREWNNYILEIYLPSILFVMISWLSFWMQITAAPARVSLGMTTMLTLVTSSQSTRDKLPRIGYIHALDVWIAFCTCLIFLSLLEFALVSYIHRYAVNKKTKEEERQKKEKEKVCKMQQQGRNSQMFPSLTARKGSMLRQNSDTTEYNLADNGQFVHLVNKLNHISLTLPINLGNYSRQSAQLDKDSTGPFTINLRYPEKEPEKEKPARLFCCLLWCKTSCQGDKLADAIDRKCRFIFPIAFVAFNFIYFYLYLVYFNQNDIVKYNELTLQ